MREARVTAPRLARMKRDGQKIVMLTAYDFPFAEILDRASIDVLLVGDSLGNVVQGNDTTLPVTVDQMIYHSRMVSRGVHRALVVCDLPIGSYQVGVEDAVRNAFRVACRVRAPGPPSSCRARLAPGRRPGPSPSFSRVFPRRSRRRSRGI